VEKYLESDDRLIMVIGSCEQHGYLSLLTDVKIPFTLAETASKRTGILVAPPINFGASPYFLSYPGTLSLRISTLLNVVEDLLRSAYGYGFRRILFLNGHGGNEPVRARLYELASELSGLRIAWYAWWLSHSVEAVAGKHGLRSYHAGWIEAFPFTRVADLPDKVKTPPKVPGLLGAEEARSTYGDGVFGGPYQVEQAIMDDIFEAAVADVLHILRFD
jgi:creatinine amidohydrolase